jgi:hypothetical protein
MHQAVEMRRQDAQKPYFVHTSLYEKQDGNSTVVGCIISYGKVKLSPVLN